MSEVIKGSSTRIKFEGVFDWNELYSMITGWVFSKKFDYYERNNVKKAGTYGYERELKAEIASSLRIADLNTTCGTWEKFFFSSFANASRPGVGSPMISALYETLSFARISRACIRISGFFTASSRPINNIELGSAIPFGLKKSVSIPIGIRTAFLKEATYADGDV